MPTKDVTKPTAQLPQSRQLAQRPDTTKNAFLEQGVTERDKTTRQPSPGQQLTLFQTFLCNTEEQREQLSNSIEFWDSVPKYSLSRQEMNKRRDPRSGYLPTVERHFHYRADSWVVRIKPARITDANGQDREFYPGAREELIEDALRKLAAQQHHGFYEENEERTPSSGVFFTLYALRQELKRRGHTMSYQQVVQSLDVMAGCRIEMLTEDNHKGSTSAILPDLMRVSRSEYRAAPESRWFARFHALVGYSIQQITYRQYDYHTMMDYRTQLARWLHKRLWHSYRNAHVTVTRNLSFSDVQQDSGLLQHYKQTRDAVRKLEEAFIELKDHKVLLSFERTDEIRGPRNKLLDVAYKLTPHCDFAKKMKVANKRHTDALECSNMQLEQRGTQNASV